MTYAWHKIGQVQHVRTEPAPIWEVIGAGFVPPVRSFPDPMELYQVQWDDTFRQLKTLTQSMALSQGRPDNG